METWNESHDPYLGPRQPRRTPGEVLVSLAQSAEMAMDRGIRSGTELVHKTVELARVIPEIIHSYHT